MERFKKLDSALKNYLRGAGYHDALRAYSFAKKFHVGTRRDGVTPEFQHQIEIALFATTLRNVMDEQGLICVILMHDVMEDYDVPRSQIVEMFGAGIEDSTWRVTKVYQGVKKSPDQLFRDIAEDPRSSLCKGLDRIHNQQTMTGVFSNEKIREYIAETNNYILPMLKQAAYNFPEQYLAYMNIRVMIKSQIALIEAALKACEAERIGNG